SASTRGGKPRMCAIAPPRSPSLIAKKNSAPASAIGARTAAALPNLNERPFALRAAGLVRPRGGPSGSRSELAGETGIERREIVERVVQVRDDAGRRRPRRLDAGRPAIAPSRA